MNKIVHEVTEEIYPLKKHKERERKEGAGRKQEYTIVDKAREEYKNELIQWQRKYGNRKAKS